MEIFIFFHFPDFPGGFRSRRSIPQRVAASLHSAAARTARSRSGSWAVSSESRSRIPRRSSSSSRFAARANRVFFCRRCTAPAGAAGFRFSPAVLPNRRPIPSTGPFPGPADGCVGDESVVFHLLTAGTWMLPSLKAVRDSAVFQAAPGNGSSLVPLSPAAAGTAAAQAHGAEAAVQSAEGEHLV